MAPSPSIPPLMPPPLTTPAPASILQPQPDDAQFPQGQCRFILIQPELKGQRCACVCFTRNKSLPGATCECGHQACYHMSTGDAPSPGRNHDAIELVKQRVQLLEQQAGFSGERRDLNDVVARLSQLEEATDKSREELQQEIKGSYRNISAAWQLIEQLQRQMAAFEETNRMQSAQLARAGKQLQDLANRNLELLETDEMLEERIEKLEGMDTLPSPAQEPTMRGLHFHDVVADSLSSSASRRRYSTSSHPKPVLSNLGHSSPIQPQRSANTRAPSPVVAEAWTVHISLLPSRTQPFPFEKDSTAYKRCLSRGLQRMVAVEGTSGDCFVAAVTRAFRGVLRDVSWEVLRAQIPHSDPLEETPRLQPLDSDVPRQDYSMEFLRDNCATCDASGRMQALYVAVQDDRLSWSKMKSLPIYIEGLEASWDFDGSLDEQEPNEDDVDRAEPGGGQDEAWTLPPSADFSSLKRGVSEMQSPSLATGGAIVSDGEGPRVKRNCMPDMIRIR